MLEATGQRFAAPQEFGLYRRNGTAERTSTVGITMSRMLIVAVLAVVILAVVAALDWYSHVLAGITSGGPVPLQSVAPRPPVASAAPAVRRSSAPASVQVTPSAAAASTPSPSGSPKIINLSLSSSVASGGQIVTGTVTTSPDVTSVQARIAGYSSALSRIGVGYFALSYRVPNLPAFLHRTYTIEVIAQNARGASVSSSLPITIR